MQRLSNKVAIITGAASGQGAAEAKRFAEEGAQVVLADINDEAGTAIARTIGARALFVAHDVADQESWSRLVDAAIAAFGGVDILVNNAGVYRQKPLQETDLELMDFHYGINVLGPFFGMKAVHAAMVARGGGSIINVSSALALRAYPGVFAYASSKWMVRGMGKCAAVDLAADKIRVNTILPGLIDTPMLAENSREYLDAIARTIPANRLGLPEEIASAAVYLASDEAAYVSGAEISVCGAGGA